MGFCSLILFLCVHTFFFSSSSQTDPYFTVWFSGSGSYLEMSSPLWDWWRVLSCLFLVFSWLYFSYLNLWARIYLLWGIYLNFSHLSQNVLWNHQTEKTPWAHGDKPLINSWGKWGSERESDSPKVLDLAVWSPSPEVFLPCLAAPLGSESPAMWPISQGCVVARRHPVLACSPRPCYELRDLGQLPPFLRIPVSSSATWR